MASMERDPIMGVWGRAPVGLRAEPLVRGSGPEAEMSVTVGCPNEAASLLLSRVFSKHSVTNHVGLF